MLTITFLDLLNFPAITFKPFTLSANNTEESVIRYFYVLNKFIPTTNESIIIVFYFVYMGTPIDKPVK